MKQFWKNNNLTIVLLVIFCFSLIGMSLAGWMEANIDAREHNQPQETYVSYIQSGDFVEGVFENWESEFLQMFALVVLTVFLTQKGAEDANEVVRKQNKRFLSRYEFLRARTLTEKGKALKKGLYAHSLSLALLVLFLFSFVLHAVGGAEAYNSEAAMHGQLQISAFSYLTTPRFWYESLQNWQSEFLSVAVLLVLSIWLRERGSSQSKPLGKRYNKKTGI